MSSKEGSTLGADLEWMHATALRPEPRLASGERVGRNDGGRGVEEGGDARRTCCIVMIGRDVK